MDDDLRELRREVAAHPGDSERLRALAAAEERAGERRGAFLSWCALARTGDRAAQARVLGWSPWPCARGLGRARRARRAGITRPPELEWREDEARSGGIGLATDGLALGQDLSGAPWALGPDLARAWAYRGEAPGGAPGAALCGDDLAWCTRDRLFLLDAGRGTLRAEAPLPFPPGLVLEARGDRLILVGRGEEGPALVCLDLGREFGRVVWPRAEERDAGEFLGLRPAAWPRQRAVQDVVIGGAWAWLELSDDPDPYRREPGTGLAAVRVETGVPYHLPGLRGPLDPGAARGWSLLAADEAGVLLEVVPDDGGPPLLYSVDARSGALGWARPQAALTRRVGDGVALGPTLVALSGFASEGRALRLEVLDRTDGRLRWWVELPLQGEFPPHESALALADGALTFAWTAPRPTFLAWEPETGRELWRRELPAELQAPGGLLLIPRAGELLFEVQGAFARLRGCLRG